MPPVKLNANIVVPILTKVAVVSLLLPKYRRILVLYPHHQTLAEGDLLAP